MVHPTHATSASYPRQSEPVSDQTQRINRFALAVFASFVLFVAAPLEIFILLSAGLVTWSLLNPPRYTRAPLTPIYVSLTLTSHFSTRSFRRVDLPPRAPRSWEPRPVVPDPTNRSCARAGVGVRTDLPPTSVAPDPTSQSSARAGVGVRTARMPRANLNNTDPRAGVGRR